MSQKKWVSMVCMGCILALFTGCGMKASSAEPRFDDARDIGEQLSERAHSDAGDESGGYWSVGEVKAAVLENAGLLDEDVRFVRIHLDSGSGAAKYEVEFLCETAEYDYTVDARTGEILSMNFEIGDYDIAAVPEEILPPGPQNEQPSADMPSESHSDMSSAGVPSETHSDMPSGGVQSGTQSGMSSPDPRSEAEQYIGVEAAKQAALLHAGLQADAVQFKHAHLEFDDGYWKYDVEFHNGSTEYDYDIDARTGEVISFHHDAEDDRHGSAGSSDGVQITADEAKRIALEYAGIAETEAQRLKTEFDYDDGRAEFEVEWHVGRVEYSCSVDASTGAVISFEREAD